MHTHNMPHLFEMQLLYVLALAYSPLPIIKIDDLTISSAGHLYLGLMTCLLMTLYSFVFLFLFILCWYLLYESSLCLCNLYHIMNQSEGIFWDITVIFYAISYMNSYFVRICFILIIELICFSGTTSSKLLSNLRKDGNNTSTLEGSGWKFKRMGYLWD